jgi:hypothetical protein
VIADLFPDKSSLPATLNPPLVCSGVEWDLEVARPSDSGVSSRPPAARVGVRHVGDRHYLGARADVYH